MEELKLERRKSMGILRKTWERCKSFGNLHTKKVPQSPTSTATTSTPPPSFSPSPRVKKSKSCSSLFSPRRPTTPTTTPLVADCKGIGSKHGAGPCVPHGCFSVNVGPDRRRFVIKVECTKHPLFKMLLEEAESEYGYHSDGPLVLPCDVHSFLNVLLEMDADQDVSRIGCRFPISRSSYNLLSPPRSMLALNQF